jgi:hypothetical protein
MSGNNDDCDPTLSYRNLQALFEGIAAIGNGDSVYAADAAQRFKELAEHYSGHRVLGSDIEFRRCRAIADVGWACRKKYIANGD